MKALSASKEWRSFVVVELQHGRADASRASGGGVSLPPIPPHPPLHHKAQTVPPPVPRRGAGPALASAPSRTVHGLSFVWNSLAAQVSQRRLRQAESARLLPARASRPTRAVRPR
eukprot:3482344-Prymnesium_polylepis.2